MEHSLLLATVMGSQLSHVGSCKASMHEGTGTAGNKPVGGRLGSMPLALALQHGVSVGERTVLA